MRPSRVANIPSFQQFILRSEVLMLYRRVLRLGRRSSSIQQRHDIRLFARHQLNAMAHVTDAALIRHLIADGKRQCESLETMMNLAH